MNLVISADPVSPYFERALQETRQFIFNYFPIRVLTFNSDGGEIRLVERGEVWKMISAEMALEFDDEKIVSSMRGMQTMANNYRAMRRHRGSANLMANAREHNSEHDELIRRAEGGIDAKYQNEVISDFCWKYKNYAILSHTWLQDTTGEVTYGDWTRGNINYGSSGYQKLESFCRVAAQGHGQKFGWMDTVCINKDSSSELDESIRRMYSWYQKSTVCIVYLEKTTEFNDIHYNRWFKRGWTLQELVAPKSIAFYTADWRRFSLLGGNDWQDPRILGEIQMATTITSEELKNFVQNPPPISRRMQWAAGRQVTREEDSAYSLMGLFGVSISTAYGEGAEHAFLRLVKEILSSKTENLLDIVNYGHTESAGYSDLYTSKLLPASPQLFAERADSLALGIWRHYKPTIPVTLTQLGLHVSALLIPAILRDKSSTTWPPFTPHGDFFATATASIWVGGDYFDRSFNLLDEAIFTKTRPDGWIMFAVLNHTINGETIELGTTCFAVAFENPSDYMTFSVPDNDSANVVYRRPTHHPITFRLCHVQKRDNIISIAMKDLEKNGIYLRTLYM